MLEPRSELQEALSVPELAHLRVADRLSKGERESSRELYASLVVCPGCAMVETDMEEFRKVSGH